MLSFYEYLRKLSGKLVLISYVSLIGATLFIVIDVVLRYVFKAPLLGDVEVVEIIMAVMVFSSFAYTQTEKGHIHVLMILNLLPEKLRFAIFGINGFIAAIAAAAVTYGCFLQGGYAYKRHLISAMLHIPYYPFYYIACVCMMIFFVVLFADALIVLFGVFNQRYATLVKQNWM